MFSELPKVDVEYIREYRVELIGSCPLGKEAYTGDFLESSRSGADVQLANNRAVRRPARTITQLLPTRFPRSFETHLDRLVDLEI